MYEIHATAEGNPTKDQMRLMMQSLLADRFKLKVHFETREMPVFALTLVKPGQTGPKLIPHDQGPPCPDSYTELKPFEPLSDKDVFPPDVRILDDVVQTRRDNAAGTPKQHAGVPCRLDFLLRRPLPVRWISRWSIERVSAGDSISPSSTRGTRLEVIFFGPGPPKVDAQQGDLQGPTFLEAVRKQLGLKLVPGKGPVETLIVDHVEKPSEN